MKIVYFGTKEECIKEGKRLLAEYPRLVSVQFNEWYSEYTIILYEEDENGFLV